MAAHSGAELRGLSFCGPTRVRASLVPSVTPREQSSVDLDPVPGILAKRCVHCLGGWSLLHGTSPNLIISSRLLPCSMVSGLTAVTFLRTGAWLTLGRVYEKPRVSTWDVLPPRGHLDMLWGAARDAATHPTQPPKSTSSPNPCAGCRSCCIFHVCLVTTSGPSV